VACAALDQSDAVDAVVDQVPERQSHTFAHLRQGREVEDRMQGPVGQHRIDRVGIR
jgi:hypothetical protein